MKENGAPFAPTLQVAVEACSLGIDPAKRLKNLEGSMSLDTEALVEKALSSEETEGDQ